MQNVNEQIHLFKGLQRLVPSEFDSKLQDSNKKNSILSEKGWSLEAVTRGVFFDLSQVRWVEISAVGQLVLLIESAKDFSINVTIAFPLNDLTKKEKEHLETLANEKKETELQEKKYLFNNIKKLREKTLNYLKVINFDNVIECRHIKRGSIKKVYNYSFETENTVQPNESEKIQSENQELEGIESPKTNESAYNYVNIIPLTWINYKNQDKNLKSFKEQFNKIIGQPKRGLDAVDAETINNVIISELTKNVLEHSQREFGLIGAALQPTMALSKHNADGLLSFDDYNTIERNYIEWTALNNEYYIALFFGDSGRGLINDDLVEAYKTQFNKKEAKSEEVIRWSFDKWSTGKTELETRGTKGLYRIHRIVNKYNGMILIRTNNSLGGFQKGGVEAPQWTYSNTVSSKTYSNTVLSKKELSYFPGTIVKMHFTPYKEILKINTHLSKNLTSNTTKFDWVSKSINLEYENPEKTFSGNLSLKKIFSNNNKNLLLVINAPEKYNGSEKAVDDLIINHLKYLSLGRHPNGVLVYIVQKSWDDLDSKIDSLNQLIFDHKILPNSESLHPDKEDIYDPILVLGERGQYSWVGDNLNTISVLNELYQDKDSQIKLEELSSFTQLDFEEQTRIIQFVSNDNAILSLTGEQELRINFSDIVQYYSCLLKEKIDPVKKSFDDKKIFLTPNLRYIKNWIDIKSVISDNVAGYALALFFEYSNKINAASKSQSRLKILIDNNENKELANQFALLVGVQPSDVVNIVDEVDGRLPRRNKIFEDGEDVIILTTIISTSETIRRSIKSVQRDLANPVAILGLLNQSNAEEITTWGKNIPIITLTKDSMSDVESSIIEKHKKNDTVSFIEPYSFKATDGHTNDNSGENDKILSLIESSKSLHFNHLGKANNRHFTFYLSPNMMLADDKKCNELVIDKFQNIIDNWTKQNGVTDFEIWRPTLDFKFNDPLDKISDSISKNHLKKNKNASQVRVSKIKRTSLYGEWSLIDEPLLSSATSKNLIIIDWGTLTGSTIQQMVNLAVKHEKENILVCILFSQFSKQDAIFYQNLNEVKILKRKDANDMFSEKELKPASVSVNFIYQFPLKYYESFNCPVCEHIKALEEYEIKGYHMGDFSVKRRMRLKIKDKSIADGTLPPQDFYSDYGENLSELDSTLILKMFKLRVLFEEAIESTKKRNQILENLEKILKNIDGEKRTINSDLYALLYFLSIEIMWLQKPPLVFLSVRQIISKLSIEIAKWDRNEMEKYISNDNKMVVRFKFSAISVLRSSDKMLLCENIYEIFFSSLKDGNYSHNLTQNLFYHIHSLLLKKYHTSKKYFKKTIENLDKIIATPNVNPSLHYVVQYLRNLAQKKLYLISLEGKTKIELIKSLKKEIEDYYGITDHSEIFEIYRRMAIENVEEPIKRFDINSADYTTKLNQIDEWAKGLPSKWGQVSGYIESVVNNHLSKLSDLYDSQLFKLFRMHEYFPVDSNSIFVGYDDEFTKLINNISSNPADAKLYYDTYKTHYTRYLVGLFSSKKLSHANNSKLINFLNEMPTEIDSTIKVCIQRFTKKFVTPPKIIFTNETPINVFYPKEEFAFAISQILGNVEKHVVSKEDIPNCSINISIEIATDKKTDVEYVEIKISNTGTTDKSKNAFGALSQIKQEMRLFGGECTHSFNDESIVTIKLLNYGEQ